LRPLQAPIYAFSPSEEVMRQMTLLRAVHPAQMSFSIDPQHTVADAENYLKRQAAVDSGDPLIVLSDILAGEERFDAIHLRRAF
jgi:pyruvate kinase